jgi:folate-binding protein YgfZ
MTSPSDAARDAALIVENQDYSTLLVSGSERREWLNAIVTGDVRGLQASQGAFSLLLTKPGKIVSELVIVASDSELYLGVPASTVDSVRKMLEGLLIMEDAELFDRSADFSWLMLHGPRSVELGHTVGPGAGKATAIGAIDWTGLGGAALVVRRDQQEELVEALVLHGAVRSTPDDWLRLRVERGLPAYGVDYDSRDNPHEASLDRRAISWTKGCYLGQEAVCMQDMRGKVKRRVVALGVAASEVPAPGTPVEQAGKTVGHVTSAVQSERAARPLVLARLSTRALESSEPLLIGRSVARPLDPLP